MAQSIQPDRLVPQSTRKVENGENKCFYNFAGEITVTQVCMDAEDIRIHTYEYLHVRNVHKYICICG